METTAAAALRDGSSLGSIFEVLGRAGSTNGGDLPGERQGSETPTDGSDSPGERQGPETLTEERSGTQGLESLDRPRATLNATDEDMRRNKYVNSWTLWGSLAGNGRSDRES